MAIAFWFTTSDDPVIVERRRTGASTKRIGMELALLKDLRVWRLSFYYFFTFGAFVALALWLPRYLIGVYGFDIETAGILGAAYSIPASIFRAYGGVLSDRIGPRTVLYWCFSVSAIATLALSLPPTDYVMHGTRGAIAAHFEITPLVFVGIMIVLGFFMSIGKAAVYKHIATYYPDNVGSVGGFVGMVGGLGGFVLPIAFGFVNQASGLWTSCFMLLFVIVMALLLWMHVSIRLTNKSANPENARRSDAEPGLSPISGRV
jgi:NNP family nitrate/nitrite transporter-like MFS transporter